MTGPSGNRLSICPLRFRIASPRVPIDLGWASVNRNSWGGLLPSRPVIICLLLFTGKLDLSNQIAELSQLAYNDIIIYK